jgi:hypothetical protein
MCLWQLPPFLLFGIFMTFVFPLFRRGTKDIDKEDEVVRRIKRRIEVKWGLYCVLSLLLWIVLVVGIVVLIIKTTSGSKVAAAKGLATRWVSGSIRETWKIYY